MKLLHVIFYLMSLFVCMLSILKVSLLIHTLVFVLLDKLDKKHGYHLFINYVQYCFFFLMKCCLTVPINIMCSLLNWIINLNNRIIYFPSPPILTLSQNTQKNWQKHWADNMGLISILFIKRYNSFSCTKC